MIGTPRLLPRRRDDVLVAEFDTEVVVLVASQRQAHRLDAGLSLVLTACDGLTEASSLVDEVRAGTGDSVVATEAWLDSCLETLAALGVFEAAASCGSE